MARVAQPQTQNPTKAINILNGIYYKQPSVGAVHLHETIQDETIQINVNQLLNI